MNESSQVPEGAAPPRLSSGWRSPRRRAAEQVEQVEQTPWGSGEPRRRRPARAGQQTNWTRHLWSVLVDSDRDQLVAIAERVGCDRGRLVDTFCVGRNRYGLAVMVGQAEVAGDDVPVEILGQRVIRWQLVPVPAVDLPAAVGGSWRADR